MYLGGVNILETKLLVDRSCFYNTGSFNEFLIMGTMSMDEYFFNRNPDCRDYVLHCILSPLFIFLRCA